MKSTCLNLSLAVFIALLTAVSSRAQTAPPSNTNAPAKERFLVIVETSTTMLKRTNNTERALGSIISTGLKGQIASGCTIGLWTFNEKLNTGQVPLQLWTDADRQRVALNLVQAVQRQKYEKTGKLGVAWTVATNIVAQSERLTLLIFSSGSEPVTGTPYDAAIAESFRQNSEQQRTANMPFLTILRAANGKFVASAVNMPPWPLEVPEWPEEFKPKPAPPEPKAAPTVVTSPPVGKRVDPTVLSPTNTIYLVEPTPPIEAATIEAATTSAPPQLPTTNPVVAAPQMIEPPASNPPVVAAPVEIKPEPTASASETPKTKQPIVTLLIVGIGVLLGVLVAFIVLLRRTRRPAGESLITRSMNKNDR
jgi:hypothetical protein